MTTATGGSSGASSRPSAQGVDGVLLEAELDAGVDGGGDAVVGVAKEFLDHDEADALVQERVAVECRG
ncbi:hypothetical protein [Streptomyces sp. NPDC087525]|uniref:hypothetical protein n=1 Tax=Streptomyces sp. NPDC087525 TaxID=3365793 RepID=UPI00380CB6C1